MTSALPGKPLVTFFQLLKTRFCLLILTRNAFVGILQIPMYCAFSNSVSWTLCADLHESLTRLCKDIFETLILV